jgi:hypothetical protein
VGVVRGAGAPAVVATDGTAGDLLEEVPEGFSFRKEPLETIMESEHEN